MTTTWPAAPLGVEADLYLGTWTSIGSYIYQRDPVTISRGRPDEASQVNPSQATMTLNNRDGRFTIRNPAGAWYGTISQNTPFRISVPGSLTGGGTYLRLEDDNFSSAQCSDSTSLRITGSIDVYIDCQLTGYQAATLAYKWGGSGQAWRLGLNGNGTITFYWYDGTSSHSATSTVALPYLGRQMIRATLNAATGVTTFNTAPAMGGSQTQLGATVAFGGATSISVATGQPVIVGHYITDPGDPSLQGQVYEFQLVNGITGSGGTTVADPKFLNQAAGATSFADTQGNTWSMAGTAELSSKLYRFHGELASVPKAADPSGRDVYSQATASGVLRRLQQQQNPASSAMYRAYVRLGGTTAPVAYWPCEDGTNAASFASGLPGGAPMAFSAGATLATSSQFACSAPLPEIGTSTWTGTVSAPGTTWTDNVVRFLLYNPAGNIPNQTVLCRVFTTGTVGVLEIVYFTGGALNLSGYSGPGGTLLFSTGNVTFGIDGEEVRLSMALQTDGSGVEYSTQTMMPGQGALAFNGVLASGTVGAVTSVVINPNGAAFGSAVGGHLSVQPVWDTLFDLSDALNAWTTETAGNRYARLCTEEGIGCRIYGFPAVSTEMGNQTLQSIPELLQEIETTDMGMQFEPRTCLGLGYVTRTALYNQTADAVASYTSQQISQGFAATADDLLVINDITLSNPDGSSNRQVLASGPMSVQAPPNGISRVDTSLNVNDASDADLPNLANWLLWVRTVNDDRYPQIPFNLARAVTGGVVTPAAVPLLDIGSYLQLTNTPAWVPPGPVRQLCAGFAETLGPAATWLITVNGIPEAPYEVAVAGTAHAMTDGSALNATMTTTATTVTVSTTAGDKIWTTSGGDFPFGIVVAGEQMTVTNITGSSSPQTFTVTRSVNGVVKTHSSGEAIALYNVPVAAL